MRRRKHGLSRTKVEIPGLINYKPRFAFSFRPAGFSAIVRQPNAGGTETAIAAEHRDSRGGAQPMLRRPAILQRATPEAFGAVARVPLARRGPELQFGVLTDDRQGCLALGVRGRDSASTVAIKSPSLATTPIERSRLELAAAGASVGARQGLGGMLVGGIAGYLAHRALESVVESLLQ